MHLRKLKKDANKSYSPHVTESREKILKEESNLSSVRRKTKHLRPEINYANPESAEQRMERAARFYIIFLSHVANDSGLISTPWRSPMKDGNHLIPHPLTLFPQFHHRKEKCLPTNFWDTYPLHSWHSSWFSTTSTQIQVSRSHGTTYCNLWGQFKHWSLSCKCV